MPLCPSNSTSAFDTAPQRLRLLTISPFLAPCICKTTLESGASGEFSSVALIPPWAESILVDDLDVDEAVQVEDQVGQLVV